MTTMASSRYVFTDGDMPMIARSAGRETLVFYHYDHDHDHVCKHEVVYLQRPAASYTHLHLLTG